MSRAFMSLVFSLTVAGVAHAQNYGLPTVPGETKTPTTISNLHNGISMFIDYSNPDDIQVNLGADPAVVKQYAHSGSLSVGNTDAQSDAMQRVADSFPVFYSYVMLGLQAKQIWRMLYNLDPQNSTVDFNFVVRTTNPDGTLQDHLIESFTCTSTTNVLCDAGDFGKLSGSEVTPWFKQSIGRETSRTRGVQP